MTHAHALPDVRALCFDVFGTVVDWHGSIAAEVQRLRLPVDGSAFALAWRAGYQPAMQQVRSGALPWTNIDGLHRRILDGLLAEHGIAMDEAARADLNRIWHRLQPWPDSVAGLLRLKRRYTLTTLSNGNLSLLVAMAKFGGLPWDAVLTAEFFHHYKPDPEVYLGAARLLDLAPEQVMLVAAHPSDLRAAAACGLRTAYVARPLERGPGGAMERWTPGEFDLAVDSFEALAATLGLP
ncbi:haloacid dehalogenase type II [Rubrivivax rivuli]|uniref:(S)-2-haloacid dehalogenase n=1 Tax=Rubrivivax rivuli TaxID=1862385 RepID=A0A437RR07_9BURK|nr:haloacid dehalogenase type II [Rubrivivax rivuli]RVU49227.1 haloacid dehalogenase type II [Rubrivivax rivuli]